MPAPTVRVFVSSTWLDLQPEQGGSALFNIGLALDKLGDRAQAIAHAEEALEIFEQLKSPHVEKLLAPIAQWRGQ